MSTSIKAVRTQGTLCSSHTNFIILRSLLSEIQLLHIQQLSLHHIQWHAYAYFHDMLKEIKD